MPKQKKNKCQTPYCRNEAKGKFCSSCRCRKSRQRHPMRYSYFNLKTNAKRRGKIFELSFDYFKKFCRKTKYMSKKGIYKDCYSIDCIDPRKGYVEGNIQILPVPENSRKGAKILVYDWMTKTAYYTRDVRQESVTDFF